MDSNLTSRIGLAASPAVRPSQTFDLYAYCYGDRLSLIPQLTSALNQCGGWILERRTLSPTAMDFCLEIQLVSIVELYGALVALGLELTRAAHAILTDLCTCRKHIARSRNPHQIVTLRLEIAFLADVTLHSILMTGSSLA